MKLAMQIATNHHRRPPFLVFDEEALTPPQVPYYDVSSADAEQSLSECTCGIHTPNDRRLGPGNTSGVSVPVVVVVVVVVAIDDALISLRK